MNLKFKKQPLIVNIKKKNNKQSHSNAFLKLIPNTVKQYIFLIAKKFPFLMTFLQYKERHFLILTILYFEKNQLT